MRTFGRDCLPLYPTARILCRNNLIHSIHRYPHMWLVVVLHRPKAQILCKQTIFGVKIRRQIENVLGKGVAVGWNRPEKRPFIGHSMTIVNL